MSHTTVTLDGADAVELAELLEFLNDWLHSDDVAASYGRFTFGLLTVGELRADLCRFAFLLGGNNHHYLDEKAEW
jgi:hypothetical protein